MQNDETRRTKEQLIAAREEAVDEQVLGRSPDGVHDQATASVLAGDVTGALDGLARQAANLWERRTLAAFDLRRVDEQGRLIAAGWLALPTRPGAGKCLAVTAPNEQCLAPATHAGHEAEGARCWDHAPERYTPLASVCLTWQAGDHLDEVLAEGARRVTERARQALLRPAELPANVARAVSTLKPGELLRAAGVDLAPRSPDPRLVETIELSLPEGPWAILVSGGRLREGAMRAIEKAADTQRAGGGPARLVLEVPRGARVEVKPLARGVPETREQFLSALGIEEGRSYPGLREKIAEWSGLPLTEEQARLEEEANRRVATGRCGRCPDPVESITCWCSPTHTRVVARSDAFASGNGWRCATCTASEALGALNAIAAMLDLPAGGELPTVVPAAVTAVLTASRAMVQAFSAGLAAARPLLTDEQRDALDKAFAPLAHFVEAFSLRDYRWKTVLDDRPHGPRLQAADRPDMAKGGDFNRSLIREADPAPRGALVAKLPSGREVTLERGHRLLFDAVVREAVERGAPPGEAAAEIGGVLDELVPFAVEHYEALLRRARAAGVRPGA